MQQVLVSGLWHVSFGLPKGKHVLWGEMVTDLDISRLQDLASPGGSTTLAGAQVWAKEPQCVVTGHD